MTGPLVLTPFLPIRTTTGFVGADIAVAVGWALLGNSLAFGEGAVVGLVAV